MGKPDCTIKTDVSVLFPGLLKWRETSGLGFLATSDLIIESCSQRCCTLTNVLLEMLVALN